MALPAEPIMMVHSAAFVFELLVWDSGFGYEGLLVGVATLREEKNVKEWYKKWDEVRAKWRNKNLPAHDWRLETPGDIRDGALKDLKKALKSNLGIRKAKGGEHRFSFKFRSRKDASESLYLCKRNLRINGGDHVDIYPRSNLGKLGSIKMTGISILFF